MWGLAGGIEGVWTLRVVPLAGTYYTRREFRLAQGARHRRSYLPTLVLAATFLLIVFGWGFGS
jgi:hypothetical protein